MADGKGILRNTAVVGGATALSRVLGLVREMLQSRLIGAGWEQSAFTLAFAIPNMARKLFGEGALTAAFVPIFKGEIEKEGLEKAQRLARAVLSMMLLMLGATVALGVLGLTAWISTRSGWNLDPEGVPYRRLLLTLRATRILLPYMIFICGAAFGMGVLNAMGRFAAASLMPCLLNVCWIAVLGYLAFFGGDLNLAERVQRIAVAILVAGFLQMAFMFWCMRRRGISPGFTFSGWLEPDVKRVWRNTALAALGAGAVQINYALDQILAQCAAPWAAGVIGYAERLMDLPLGVVGVAFGTVLLPTFAGLFAKNDVAGAREAFFASSRSMLFVMLPAAVGIGVLAPEITAAIYKGGAFDADAVRRVSRAVACYAFGLGFFGLQKSLVPWFQAQNDMKTPLKISTCAVVLNAVLNVLSVFCLPVEWRHVGLAGSTVICAGLSCLWLGVLAVRRNGELGFCRLVRPVIRILGASVAMGGVIGWLRMFAWPHPVVALAVTLPAGAIIYFAASWLLLPEMRGFRLRSSRTR